MAIRSFPRRALGWLASLTLCACLSACVQGVFYQPDRILYDTPHRAGLSFEEVMFNSHDEARLGGWFIPALGVNSKMAKGTVIQLHGNGQNMSSHWRSLAWFPSKGYNLFVFDYRGYGISEGSPNVEDVMHDSIAAIDYIRNRPDSPPDKIIVYGQSLGGTNAIVAVANGSKNGIKAVIVESTFSSYSKIAHDKVPGAGWLMSDRYSADQWIDRLAPTPLLLLHGDHDKVIPYQHSQGLMARAKPPKELIVVPGAGHLTLFQGDGAEHLQNQIISFIEADHGRVK